MSSANVTSEGGRPHLEAIQVFTFIIPRGAIPEMIMTNFTSNSYTMGCPPVCGDNPRALASGLSYVQVDKHGITILYHLHQCRPLHSMRYFVIKLVSVV